MGKGYLKIELFTAEHALPVQADNIVIRDTKGKVLYNLSTDENGITVEVPLEAPDKSASVSPESSRPGFAVYDVEVPLVRGFKRAIIHNVEIFDGVTSILPIQMYPSIRGVSPFENINEITIPLEHGVNFDRIMQAEPDVTASNADISATQILANEVNIPQYITVHLGSPNSEARNVRVPFIDYIKNVASSEIFPTWEEAALIANIYAQISFALNRVYTEIR